MEYNATCTSADAPGFSNTTSNEFLVFTQAHDVRAGIDYICHVTMTVTAFNGTNLLGDSVGFEETQTSPQSEKVPITTLEGKGKENSSASKKVPFLALYFSYST